MGIFKSIIISLSILFSFSIPLYAETTKANDPNEQTIYQTITAFMAKNGIPGVAVETFVNGRPHAYYFGYANKTKKTPITKETIFEIGSISKVMTSLLLAQEIDFARASLDDSVKKYNHNLADDFKNITLKSLATHTSGLPMNAPQTINSRQDLDKYLAKWSSSKRPGSVWIYSNVGIGLLGFVLESLNDHTFDELYLNRILAPLGMHSVSNAKDIEAHLAQGYDRTGNPVKSVSLALFPAAYGVKASAEDMRSFLKAAIGLPGTTERIFYPMRLTQTAFVALPNRLQGLGWQIHRLNSSLSKYSLLSANDVAQLGPVAVLDILDKPTFDGDALIDKAGSTSGFRAYIAVIPNKKSGLVILTNKYLPDNELVKIGRAMLFAITKDIN